MALISDMAFSPATGLRDTTTYPTVPASETAAREQIQGRMDELRDYINNDLVNTLNLMILMMYFEL